jgi:hypothetical protein
VDGEGRGCRHTKPDGQACRAAPRAGREWCFHHDPDSRRERQAARRKGGRASRKPSVTLAATVADVALGTVPEVVAFLAATANQVRRGELDVKAGNCLAYIASIVLRAVQPDETARAIEELRAQVEELKRHGDGSTAPGVEGPPQGVSPPPGRGGGVSRPAAAGAGPGGDALGGGDEAGPLAGDLAPLFG